ncbi:cytochrome oxidase maturation protein, cbb3-type [Mesorhizobium tianshanense]|uniref:Cbb3-type cytochrome oxidase maturation protein n=1 Tax=Mesorhizobium tianshanense TaxID=39844 RepID=A0A562MW91_9HYPH|nr:cbb3-type cytochrome oxidase assembly protein CcoS [Mesorhizobium tianshanense]TWI24136.1 cbb3-type cytochrome oxidase maturation protein [Mesorhizobium tianshanense]GLS41739.1 cytochrome oxidase maturation protein, cbb3-type [Mesorhizobium tianshanense]
MNYLVWLVPVALGMGLVGLAAFLWSMNNGQLEDLDGAAERVLLAHRSAVPASSPDVAHSTTPDQRPASDGRQRKERP